MTPIAATIPSSRNMGAAIATLPETTSPTDRPGERATWWISFAVFGALACLWALTTPLGAGPDEPAHIIKAAAVAHGDDPSPGINLVVGAGAVMADAASRAE